MVVTFGEGIVLTFNTALTDSDSLDPPVHKSRTLYPSPQHLHLPNAAQKAEVRKSEQVKFIISWVTGGGLDGSYKSWPTNSVALIVFTVDYS